jgi:hypothetical protein
MFSMIGVIVGVHYIPQFQKFPGRILPLLVNYNEGQPMLNLLIYHIGITCMTTSVLGQAGYKSSFSINKATGKTLEKHL